MMHSAIDIHALITMLAHSNQIYPSIITTSRCALTVLLAISIPSQPLFSLQDPVSRELDRVAHPFDFEELVDIRAGGTIASKI